MTTAPGEFDRGGPALGGCGEEILRAAMIARDLAFQAALRAAIESGHEHAPVGRAEPEPLISLPAHFARPATLASASSAALCAELGAPAAPRVRRGRRGKPS
ncbi:MAG TPA: hypothetical protein VIH40_05625 [Xanthobacteraceae bacterium]